MAAQTKLNPLQKLRDSGQSPWMDSLRRGWITSGELEKMIREDGISGITVNPTVFERAISDSSDYDDAIRELVRHGKGIPEIYETLLIEDVRAAADLLRSAYDAADGADGFVSVNLPPSLAFDTIGSIREAHRLQGLIDRSNIMFNIPATPQGLPAIEELTYDGVNVNATFLFSIDVYEKAARAYIRALERRAEDDEPVNRAASMASFFVSRIDVEVDTQLEEMISRTGDSDQRLRLDSLLGKAAIASAKLAYRRFTDIFSEERFKDLESQGARVQRLMWASTGSKSPRYPRDYYVENLIGPSTTNTMPPQTIFAFKNQGKVRNTLIEGIEEAEGVMAELKVVGIDMHSTTEHLLNEGVQLFGKSFDETLDCLAAKRDAIEGLVRGRQVTHIGKYQPVVDDALSAMTEQAFARRLWEKDASLWRQGPAGEKLIRKRLGWLDVVEVMCGCTKEISDFAQEIIHSGFTNAVLIGMGGSSLSPEVSLQTLHQQMGYPKFHVIDSTVPGEVLKVASSIDIAKTLFIVSSKSGMTIETLAAYRYFLEKASSLKGKSAANSFIAITDSGSPLETEARERGFRRIFLNPPDIGGRYSALSYFGLVPAAVFGADIDKLLERASRMAESCAPCVAPDSNPGIILGATMGELGLKGRDKVTIIAPPEFISFEDWAEQLIAESTGKQGTGLIPVTREPLMSPDCYGEDRQFIYLRKTGSENAEMDDKVRALEHAGHPVVLVHLDDEYDLGQEYFRWETAVASVGALLGIDAFDEPNVQESKDDIARILGEYLRTEKLDEFKTAAESDGLALLCDSETKAALDGIRSVQMHPDASVYSYIAAHLANFQPGNYFALTAFLQASSKIESIFSELRAELMSGFKAATTFNYGPGFLHSTGQLHKSGPNSGIFIQLTADDPEDVSIPGVRYSYSLLKQAQALGDGISLRSKGRPFIRLHLGDDISGNLDRILRMVKRAMEEKKR